MAKKIVLGVLLVGLIGVLVAGGVIRTLDKTEQVAEAQGQGRGRAATEGIETEAGGQGYGRGRNAVADTGESGRGAYGQGGGNVERQYPNFEAPSGEQVTYTGAVVQAPAAGVDLVVKTDDGEELVVGTGPGYMGTQGFELEAGDRIEVTGYWEDDELKAAQVTRLEDGQSITLRDEYGRPAWSGAGQRATERQAASGAAPQVQAGRGQGGQGGYGGGSGRQAAEGTVLGYGLAEVDEWQTVQGSVSLADSTALMVETADGQEVIVDGRAWRFAQEQGFAATAGDQVTLTGFDEDGEFKVGLIEDNTTGWQISIRDENGRPLWAGGGRRSG
jgi:hypothetical protein